VSATTSIEWTDRTWNPVTGCTEVSAGCDHCYAKTMHERFNGPGSFATVTVHEHLMTAPLTWRSPAKVFVNSMSDLFHPAIPDDVIVRVWAVMTAARQHTFQVLTKRHARMRSLLSSPAFGDAVIDYAGDLLDTRGQDWTAHYPAPNVWLGVSAETQQWADLRIPALLATPAAVRWVSAEPLLDRLNLEPWLAPDRTCEQCDAACPACPWIKAVVLNEDYRMWTADGRRVHGHEVDALLAAGEQIRDHQPVRTLDWVVAGGESGRGARPMHPDWARALRDQCEVAGVPFLFKQWGAYGQDGFRRSKKANGRLLDGQVHDGYPASPERAA
jgi:protein gp37